MVNKLGKAPATPPKMKLASYIRPSKLPIAPERFGWDNLVTNWPMYKNDLYGDCVWAGAAHEQMLYAAAGKRSVTFTDDSVLQAYSAVTGFNPDDPSTDTGTNVQDAAQYRQQTGILDADGKPHKIGTYLALRPGDLRQLAAAVWIFGAVGVGFQLPDTAQQQFQDGQPWTAAREANIEGGHYVPIVGRGKFWRGITWAKTQPITNGFIKSYCDEAFVYLSDEELANGVNLDGFNLAQLQDDIKQLAA